MLFLQPRLSMCFVNQVAFSELVFDHRAAEAVSFSHCVCVCLSLCVCVSVFLSACLPVCLSVCLSVCLCLTAILPVCQLYRLSACLSGCLSNFLSFSLSVFFELGNHNYTKLIQNIKMTVCLWVHAHQSLYSHQYFFFRKSVFFFLTSESILVT